MTNLKICKLCGAEENQDTTFTGKVCNNCYNSLFYGDEEIQKPEKDDNNIFSEGWCLTPKKLLKKEGISWFAKILYAGISSLCAERGYCWASNAYLAKEFNVSKRTITRALIEIQEYITIKDGMSSNRIIWINQLNPNSNGVKIKKVTKVTPEVTQEKKMRREYQFTDIDLHLARSLYEKICFNFPAYEDKKINIEEWADDIRKLREIDKANTEQISFMIAWVQGGEILKDGKIIRKFEPHDFWAKNILSTKKLRKQWFDNLVPQLQEQIKNTVKKNKVADLSTTSKSYQVTQL